MTYQKNRDQTRTQRNKYFFLLWEIDNFDRHIKLTALEHALALFEWNFCLALFTRGLFKP